MANASDLAIGAALGQRHNRIFHPIYFVSKLLNEAQQNYTTTEKELLAVVYAMENSEPTFSDTKSSATRTTQQSGICSARRMQNLA